MLHRKRSAKEEQAFAIKIQINGRQYENNSCKCFRKL